MRKRQAGYIALMEWGVVAEMKMTVILMEIVKVEKKAMMTMMMMTTETVLKNKKKKEKYPSTKSRGFKLYFTF